MSGEDPDGPPVGPALLEIGERLVRALQEGGGGGDDAAARALVARGLDEMRAIVERAQAARSPGVLPGFDLDRLPEAMRTVSAYLAAPGPATEAAAERAVADLQMGIAPLLGVDPGREDAARREQYRREARATLDAIFAAKPGAGAPGAGSSGTGSPGA